MSREQPQFVKVRENGKTRVVPRSSLEKDELVVMKKRALDGAFIVKPKTHGDVLTQTEIYQEDKESEVNLTKDAEKLYAFFQQLDLDSFSSNTVEGHLDSKAKAIIFNVSENLKFLKANVEPWAKGTVFSNISKLSAAICGTNEAAVNRIRSDPPEVTSRVQKPPPSKKQSCETTLSRLPPGVKSAISVKMQLWWAEEVHVTRELVREWLKDAHDVELSTPSIGKVLHAMGYSHRIKTYNPLCRTKDYIVTWAKNYVTKIQKLRDDGYMPFYFDETWVYSGMNPLRGWAFSNTDPYAAVSRGGIGNVVPGPAKGNGKGKRAIVLALYSEKGVLPGSVEILISGEKVQNQLMDYHSEMDAPAFEGYIQKRLPMILAEAKKYNKKPLLIFDNASYHCRAETKPPTESTTKKELRSFLQSKGVPFTNELRPQLWKMTKDWIEQNGGRRAHTVYWVDKNVKQQGVEVLRLPPYHCHLSPIELLWGQLKTYLRSLGKSGDKLEEVRKRALEWLAGYKAEDAEATFRHVRDKEAEVASGVAAVLDEESEASDVDAGDDLPLSD